MKTAVLYKSRYGYTRLYAEWLAQELGADLLNAATTKPKALDPYDVLALGGGVYAGKIAGVELFAKNAKRLRGKKLALFVVGLRDPELEETQDATRQSLRRQLPGELLPQVRSFCLPGGLDEKRLSFGHRMMMGMLKKSLQKKPEEEQTAIDKAILAGQANYLNRAALAGIVQYCKT